MPALKHRCVSDWCRTKRRGFCTQDDEAVKACKDRVIPSPRDVCRSSAFMDPDEHDKCRELLQVFRGVVKKASGVQGISGGFAEVEMHSYTGKTILARVTTGVGSDCSKHSRVVHFRISREFLNRKIDSSLCNDLLAIWKGDYVGLENKTQREKRSARI